MGSRYTLEEIYQIKSQGFTYQFDESILNMLENISKELGKPFTKYKNNSYTFYPVNQHPVQPVNINTIKKNVNTTCELEENHEINYEKKIRGLLNKLSDKNYEKIKIQILEILHCLPFDKLVNICKIIFDISSNNLFYSKVYALLYSELSDKYEFMKQDIEIYISGFIELFETIEMVDPEKDYERFLILNKQNDKRKAFASFYYQLMINKVIHVDQVLTLIQRLLNNIWEFLSNTNKKKEIEELVEVLFILYNKTIFQKNPSGIENKTIEEIFCFLSNQTTATYPGLSSRSIFKMKDIVENKG